MQTHNLNRHILAIACPAIVSNITIPLLGLCDTTICGHLGNPLFLAAIAVGTMAINAVFWCLGFLRMGTSGLTAQAAGAESHRLTSLLFTRAALLGLILGLLVIILRAPLISLILSIIGASPDVNETAALYFNRVILSAPAMLATMAISGWFLGMQTSVQPMAIAIITNLINIPASLICVYVLDMGFAGTATGTLIANWTGLAIAIILVRRFCHGSLPLTPLKEALLTQGWAKFFNVNIFIFLRSFCIMAVTMGVTSLGARMGTDILSANTVIMQFFTIFSYFIDGFAFAGEALTGHAAGRRDAVGMRAVILRLLAWGGGVTAIFTLLYMVGAMPAAHLITDLPSTLTIVDRYSMWIWILPAAGGAAFIFDGIYIGLTASRSMLISTLLGLVVFYLIVNFLPLEGNHRLWLAFVSYLAIRGVYLTLRCPSQTRRFLVK